MPKNRPMITSTLTPDQKGNIALQNGHRYSRLVWAAESNGNAPTQDREVNASYWASTAEIFYKRAFWFRLTGSVIVPAPRGGVERLANELNILDWIAIGDQYPPLRNAVLRFLLIYESTDPIDCQLLTFSGLTWAMDAGPDMTSDLGPRPIFKTLREITTHIKSRPWEVT